MADAVAAERPDLVVLPEVFNFIGGTATGAKAAAETFPDGESYRAVRSWAKDLGVFLHAGSMNERAGDEVFNTSVVFDRAGREVACYRKIHRFDVMTPDGACYRESQVYGRGTDVVTYVIDGVRVGCSICYDIRFPELYTEGEPRDKYGNSIIVGPWGTVLARAEDRVGFVAARLDFEYLRRIRAEMPVHEHRVLSSPVLEPTGPR